MSRTRPGVALALALALAAPAWAQAIPGDVAAAIDAELSGARAAAQRAAAGGNTLLAERQAQTARDRGNAAVAAIVVEAVSRYPGQAGDIVSAAVAKAPEARVAVLSAVQRAYPTFANTTAQAAAQAPAPTSGRAGAVTAAPAKGGAAAASTLPPDVLAELQRAARPSPDGTRMVAGSTGNQPLAQQIGSYDQRQVNVAMSGAVVTAIARYPNLAREITAAAVALAPEARPTIVAQATGAFPAFSEAILSGAANPTLLAERAAPEPRKPKRRVQEAPEPLWDPLETVNRGIFAVNDVLDQYALRPVALAYSYLPGGVKRSIGNFFSNLGSPALFANDLMQGELTDASATAVRFLINSTVGLGGLFDPATALDAPAHHADFGQTLHQYGMGPGPFIMLPLFGPTTLRDGVGFAADSAMRPESYLLPFAATAGMGAGQVVSRRESLLQPLDDLRANSLDYYAAIRSAYYQNRVKKLNREAGGGEYRTAPGAPGKPGDTPSTAPSNTEVDKLFDEAK